MNILDDIYGLLSSKISTKQIATQCRLNNIDTTTIKNIREIKDDTARKNEILKLPLSLAREIEDFCIARLQTRPCNQLCLKTSGKL